jgi:hypothetical protein
MTKFVLKILLVSAILIGIGFYVNYLLTGNSLNLALQNPSMPNLNISKISESVANIFDLNGEESPDTKYLYKWRDAKGIIHYTSEKPAAGTTVEKIELSNETNIVPAASTTITNQNEPHTQLQQTVDSGEHGVNIRSPQSIEQLFDQANDIKNLINEQYDQQKKSSEQQ